MNPKKDESVNENEFSFGSIGENCKNIATREYEEYENPFDESRPFRDSIKFGPEKYEQKFGDFADFSVFPTEYLCAVSESSIEKSEELDEQEKNKIDALKEEGADHLLDEIEPERSDYYRTLCSKYYWSINFICAALGAIIGSGLFILGILDDFDNLLTALAVSAGIGFAGGIIGRPVYGAVLGFIFFPITYPIYLLIVKLINNKREIKNNEVYDKYNEKIREISNKYEKQVELLLSTASNRFLQYLNIFEAKAEEACKKIEDSELISPIIDWASEKFLNYLNNNSNRKPEVILISTSLNLHFYKSDIELVISDLYPENEDYQDEYNFRTHRYAVLPDAISQTALAVAVTRGVSKKIRALQEKDKGGNDYKLTQRYLYPTIELENDEIPQYNEKDFENACISSLLLYSAKNPDYEELKHW